MFILVTGGCGYIGSHVVSQLLSHNYNVVIVDDYSNSYPSVIEDIQRITKKHPVVYNSSINSSILHTIFTNHNIQAVIHLAGHKSIAESITNPQMYYQNNVEITFLLLGVMEKYNCKRFIFSSTAAVYSIQASLPFNENSTLCPQTPYGMTKLIVENKLRELIDWNIIVLRYFNPISGDIRENPKKEYKNVVPILVECVEKSTPFVVMGTDYNTRDGTTVRDYIDVRDIARGHLHALQELHKHSFEVINLGTGNGVTLLELIQAIEKASNSKIQLIYKDRREGDLSECYSDTTKAWNILGWKPNISLLESCETLFLKSPSSYHLPTQTPLH